MPYTRITTNFELKEKEEKFVEEFHQVMREVLGIPEYDRLVLFSQMTKGFYQPTNTKGNYIVFEIWLFSGRTDETKKELYSKLCQLSEKYNINKLNTRIILNEEDGINWGIRGGQAASDLTLGFAKTK